MAAIRRKLFVSMPYGKRKAPSNSSVKGGPKEIDFDKVWEKILKPAIPADEFEAFRATDIIKSGSIAKNYIEWLCTADVVLADLTFHNANVYYELGIRHALSKTGTVLVACQETLAVLDLPFDVKSENVFTYHLDATFLVEDQDKIRLAIKNAASGNTDSPVHNFLPRLRVYHDVSGTNPQKTIDDLLEKTERLEKEIAGLRSRDEDDRLQDRLQEIDDVDKNETRRRLKELIVPFTKLDEPSLRLSIPLAVRLRKYGCFDEAIQVLRQSYRRYPSNYEVLRELGFVYRKLDLLDEAESFMKRALEENDQDGELQGMYGGLLKRREDYLGALRHYQKAYESDPGLYSVVNLGAIHGALHHSEEAVRWYLRATNICHEMITNGWPSKPDHWTYLCLGECAVVEDNAAQALDSYRKAKKEYHAPPQDFNSGTDQLKFFKKVGFHGSCADAVLSALRVEEGSAG